MQAFLYRYTLFVGHVMWLTSVQGYAWTSQNRILNFRLYLIGSAFSSSSTLMKLIRPGAGVIWCMHRHYFHTLGPQSLACIKCGQDWTTRALHNMHNVNTHALNGNWSSVYIWNKRRMRTRTQPVDKMDFQDATLFTRKLLSPTHDSLDTNE